MGDACGSVGTPAGTVLTGRCKMPNIPDRLREIRAIHIHGRKTYRDCAATPVAALSCSQTRYMRRLYGLSFL